jgi:hypothetical protein
MLGIEIDFWFSWLLTSEVFLSFIFSNSFNDDHLLTQEKYQDNSPFSVEMNHRVSFIQCSPKTA